MDLPPDTHSEKQVVSETAAILVVYLGRNPPSYGARQGGVSEFRRSVRFRGVPRRARRPFVCSVVSYFSAFPNLVLGKGAPGGRNMRAFGRNPPKYGGIQGGIVAIRRTAKFRSVPRCTAAPLCLFGSFVFPHLSELCVGRGALGAKNIRGFWRNPPKYGGLLGGVSEFRRPVVFRSFPRCTVASLCLFGSFVFSHHSQLGVGEGGVGFQKY